MKGIFVAIMLGVMSAGYAQNTMKADTSALKSIDGIVNELLRLISMEEGKSKNYKAIERLFLPSAQLTALDHDAEEAPESVTVKEFVEILHHPSYEDGFREYELHKVVDEYNGIAQVFQSYHVLDNTHDQKGITSYQLVFFQERWWIVSILWTADTNGVPVPDQYLKP